MIPASGDPLEEGTATLGRILAWRIPWTEEPSRLQAMGSQRVGHDRSDSAHTHHQNSSRVNLVVRWGPASWEVWREGRAL